MSDIERIRDTYLIDNEYVFDTIQDPCGKNEMMRMILGVVEMELKNKDNDDFWVLYIKILKTLAS